MTFFNLWVLVFCYKITQRSSNLKSYQPWSWIRRNIRIGADFSDFHDFVTINNLFFSFCSSTGFSSVVKSFTFYLILAWYSKTTDGSSFFVKWSKQSLIGLSFLDTWLTLKILSISFLWKSQYPFSKVFHCSDVNVFVVYESKCSRVNWKTLPSSLTITLIPIR